MLTDIPYVVLDMDDTGGAVVMFEQSFRLLMVEDQNALIDEWIHILLDARQAKETEH